LRWNFTTKLNYLAYADDIALYAMTWRGMQDYTEQLSETAKAIGLRINKEKTKVLKAGVHTAASSSIKVDGVELQYVEQFTYHGGQVDKGGGPDGDVT
jgi:hypothetical protein